MADQPTGNPRLASAGTGDVLTGFTLALLPRVDPRAALLGAVHLHGAAADTLVDLRHRTRRTDRQRARTGPGLLNRWIDERLSSVPAGMLLLLGSLFFRRPDATASLPGPDQRSPAGLGALPGPLP